MKLFFLLALQLFAEPKPAWEIADRWVCQMDRIRTCDAMGGDCTIKPNQIKYSIDFVAKTAGVFDPPTERIVARHFFKGMGAPLLGSTKVSLDEGDSVVISVDPREGRNEDGKSYDAILTRIDTDSQLLFYGYCRPA